MGALQCVVALASLHAAIHEALSAAGLVKHQPAAYRAGAPIFSKLQQVKHNTKTIKESDRVFPFAWAMDAGTLCGCVTDAACCQQHL